MLQVGSLLDNKYKILNEVGHGGMSVVYLAINERANKTWAVKEVRKDGVTDFEAVRQGLVVETDMLKNLSHPHLPSIIDVIDTEDSFLIVMDYIEGTSLQSLLRSSGAQPEDKVVKWGRQLCDVLGYLHSQERPIIYRDMKPANIMLKPDGSVTLIDFGTAREFKNRAMVEDTVCLGTRGYAAPEQFGGRGETDPRTDIYCLGATLYHLITGHSPAEPPYEIKPLSFWIPQYAGSGLEKVIQKCTQLDPAKRYQNCAELMYALEHYRDEDDINQAKRRRKWRSFLAFLAVGCLGLVASIGFRIALSGAEANTYDYQIQQAMSADSLDMAKEYLNAALNVRADDGEAYEAMLKKAEAEITRNDGFLTDDAAATINQLLTGKGTGSTANIDHLLRSDREEYAKVMMKVGMWYFFFRGENNDSNRKKAADTYFSKILDGNGLTEQQTNLVNLLYKMGDYMGKLNTKTSQYGTLDSEDVNYATLFTDLTTCVSGDVKAKATTALYSIKIYEFGAYMVGTKFETFSNNGISKAAMTDTLNIIRDGLSELDHGNDVADAYAQALDTLNNAWECVSRIE